MIDQCGDRAPPMPLAIRDLLVATTIVAGSLALARLAEDMGRGDDWIVFAIIIVPSVAGISLVSVLPVAVWLLRSKDLVLGLICIPVQTTIAILVTATIAAMLDRRIRLTEVFAVGTVVASFAATLVGAALAGGWRGTGWRLGKVTKTARRRWNRRGTPDERTKPIRGADR